MPENCAVTLDRVDIETLRPEHPHWSLVWMTSLIQLSVGTLVVALASGSANCIALTIVIALTAFTLNISVLHLGRPAYAWRALKMWRRSWLSREVLLFGLFFLLLAFLTSTAWLSALAVVPLNRNFLAVLEYAASVVGIAGLFASARLYLVPARPAWNTNHTPIDFLLSALLLGTAAAPTLTGVSNGILAIDQLAFVSPMVKRDVHLWFAISAAAWTANQVIRVVRLRASQTYEHRASCSLLNTYSLRGTFLVTFAFIGLAVLMMVAGFPAFALLAALAGVISSRYLFFVSVVPLNMALTFVRQVHA